MTNNASIGRNDFPAWPAQASPEEQRALRVLVIGSASAANIARAVDAVLGRFAGADVTLALPAPLDRTLRLSHERVRIAPGTTAGGLRRMAGYDIKTALFTGEGHNALKLAAFLAPAPRMLIFTEGGGMFWWSFDDRLAVWNHLRWRLSGGGPLPAQIGRMVRAVVNPIIAFAAFVVLLLWHARAWLRRQRTKG